MPRPVQFRVEKRPKERGPSIARLQDNTEETELGPVGTAINRFRLAIQRGNREEMLAVVDSYFNELAEASKPEPPIESQPLVALGLDVRTIAALEKYGPIGTIGELTERTRDQLKGIPNIGDTTVAKIVRALAKHGKSLKF